MYYVICACVLKWPGHKTSMFHISFKILSKNQLRMQIWPWLEWYSLSWWSVWWPCTLACRFGSFSSLSVSTSTWARVNEGSWASPHCWPARHNNQWCLLKQHLLVNQWKIDWYVQHVMETRIKSFTLLA